MSKSDAWEVDILKLLFQAVDIVNIAKNTGSSPLTNLYVSLHIAAPDEATGDQTSSEVNYGSYNRRAVNRTPASGDAVTGNGWDVSATGSVSPHATMVFPLGTAGASMTASHFGVGSVLNFAGKLFYTGTVTPNVLCGPGIQPILNPASIITED